MTPYIPAVCLMLITYFLYVFWLLMPKTVQKPTVENLGDKTKYRYIPAEELMWHHMFECIGCGKTHTIDPEIDGYCVPVCECRSSKEKS